MRGNACADTLLDNLTVEEMLMYTAELKCELRESLGAKREKVAAIIDQLALGGCRGVRIGNALQRGISGARYLLCDTNFIISLLIHASSSPRWLGALQQLFIDSFPSLPVLPLSPPVTCQTQRIRIIPYALIPGSHRPAFPACSSNSTKEQLFRQPFSLSSFISAV